MVRRRTNSVGFRAFSVMSLVICYLASSIIWFMWLGIFSPWYYVEARPQDHMNTLVLNILPLSFLPLTISAIIYGMSKTKLNPLGIFLLGWYVSTFEVLAFFHLLVLTWDPRASISPPYPPPEFVFLSLIIAFILTVFYVVLKKRK